MVEKHVKSTTLHSHTAGRVTEKTLKNRPARAVSKDGSASVAILLDRENGTRIPGIRRSFGRLKTSEGKNRRGRKAVSPALSSVILTGVIVVLLLVVSTFANRFLNDRLAENEFNAMKQFMQTMGLQTDDVAWTIGRTQTTRYASQFGTLNLETVALNYTVYVDGNPTFSHTTGVLLFNMPISKYTVSDNYRQRLSPSSNNHFLQEGTSAPAAHVFVVEKLHMNDGNYIRVIVAPSIRMLNSSMTLNGTQTNYLRFYLPVLSAGRAPHLSQSVTLEGTAVSVKSAQLTSSVRIHLDFPKGTSGFDNSFFGFSTVDEQITVPSGSTLQFYAGNVTTSLGIYA